jgi:hypothetical protein
MKKHKPDNISQEDWDSVESPALTNSILSSMKPVAEKHPDIPRRVRCPKVSPS